ncbi:FadR/GntR family transcriptional regulator [Aurantiacibacter luteus]|uniref:FadR/GntR family transcriptional regulator n=1 Tax=Aurantiacibacter luteus TaxID=1581420 RepID=UPI001F4CC9BC|nr:FadR/GntR family transcriptional regulator [Aurantiacibacter luteus]
MPATKKEPSHVKISRDLGVAIVTGQHQPGDILPGEIEIAEKFGISRSVVREALRMLSARGLIESKPKIGTRIKDRDSWHLLDPTLLEWMFEAAPPPKFVQSLFELRLIVEPAAAELAAKKKTARQLAVMGHAIEEMARYKLSTAEGQLADQEFHAAILEATDNELLVNLSASIGAAVRWTTYFKYRQSKCPRDPIEEHRALFEAIAGGDGPRAREVTVELIVNAERDTQAALAG